MIFYKLRSQLDSLTLNPVMEIILNNFIYQAFYPLLIPFDRFAPILTILLVPSAAFFIG